MATHPSKRSYLCAGSSSFDDPDVVEVSPAAAAAAGGWNPGHQKRKRSQVVPREIIEIDDDPDGVVIIGEKAPVEKNKHSVGCPLVWPKHVKTSVAGDTAGPSTYASNSTAIMGGFKKFDGLDIPPGMEAPLPWLQKTAAEMSSNSKPIPILDEKVDERYSTFKQFDTVDGHSDHYYVKPELRKALVVKKPSKDWAKRIQHEWKVLEKDLPDTIFVRAYEDRMDLLRVVIMGPAGTPYHDGLFFFDIYFPPQYPNIPPLVNYRSGGLRLNPNLYACGKVCLSLLNTWAGSGCEKWNPSNSTMLQVLVSIQALVLNAKPYFNEPGYANSANTPGGEKRSLTYNEDTFLLSCRTMLYSLRNPPKHFEDFVAGHFRKHGRNVLVACKAYLDGAQVGCLAGNGVQDVDEGDKSCSLKFKTSLKRLFEELLMEFTVKGADCSKFLSEKAKQSAASATTSRGPPADTTLRL
ncbi:hypothetical protein CFC21_013702 [Triticum aestivum]|uniref:E2 ubiquitin-conjugating enzyme n=2 Tax=Triticum aestivum TaxID=4565 RepID=A0A9R1IYA8_WHEAT|nr:hypothetical protein CFC21_013702 [Triticum aestivum]